MYKHDSWHARLVNWVLMQIMVPDGSNWILGCAEPKRRSTAPADMIERAVTAVLNEDPPENGLCHANEAILPASEAMIAAPQATMYTMGSNTQGHQPWAEMTFSCGSMPHHFTGQEYVARDFLGRVERPIQRLPWVPQYDGAGDQSSDEMSFFLSHQDDVMNFLALDDDADSQQLVAGQDQVEEIHIQPHLQHVVFLFLAKMRGLVMRRRRHQHGAVIESLALDSSKRMWQRAVIARFAKSERHSACLLLPDTEPAYKSCLCLSSLVVVKASASKCISDRPAANCNVKNMVHFLLHTKNR